MKLGDVYDYSTRLRNTAAHPVYDSLRYAVNLLNLGDPEHQPRAEGIIRRVIDLQSASWSDTPASGRKKYAEEPLSKAPSADWNWADFVARWGGLTVSAPLKPGTQQSLRQFTCEAQGAGSVPALDRSTPSAPRPPGP